MNRFKASKFRHTEARLPRREVSAAGTPRRPVPGDAGASRGSSNLTGRDRAWPCSVPAAPGLPGAPCADSRAASPKRLFLGSLPLPTRLPAAGASLPSAGSPVLLPRPATLAGYDRRRRCVPPTWCVPLAVRVLPAGSSKAVPNLPGRCVCQAGKCAILSTEHRALPVPPCFRRQRGSAAGWGRVPAPTKSVLVYPLSVWCTATWCPALGSAGPLPRDEIGQPARLSGVAHPGCRAHSALSLVGVVPASPSPAHSEGKGRRCSLRDGLC